MDTLTTQEQRRIKDHFEQRINQQSRKAMVDFLTSHTRYDTLNSWNKSTSYAHCIKLHHSLGLPSDIDNTKYDMISNDEWRNHMDGLIDQFDKDHNYSWQVRINGRSGGYLVLYQGGIANCKIICYPCKSMDQDEDFHDWDIDQLIDRVDLICDFDRLVADIVMEFAAFCRTYDVVDETIMISKTVRVLREKL